MKKFFILPLVFVLLFLNFGKVVAQEKENGLYWFSFNEGLKKAVDENKVVLIDVYTDWCYWCKVMDKETYTLGDIVDKLNKDFVPVKLNPEMDKKYEFNGKQMSGRELVNQLSENKLRGYPSTLFYFPKTKKAFMEVGYLEAEPFREILDKYAAMNKAK